MAKILTKSSRPPVKELSHYGQMWIAERLEVESVFMRARLSFCAGAVEHRPRLSTEKMKVPLAVGMVEEVEN